ncbi:ABC transporter substrate-binding protein [Paenibacillus senegalensis]|uniref:ABC transporter substrate-binding protein n=1 Tax=Paenibacillus senegalensis TaxID=1465766 RepID=UPI0002895469|nr:ABC transporter substrate-binding protein [Paenibacillus senegalensis]
MTKTWMKFILPIALLALIVAACGGGGQGGGNGTNGGNGGGTPEGEGGGDKKTVTIQIDGAAVPYYAPLYVAHEQGFFAEEGLEVEFLYAAAADIVKNVAAGNVQFGFPNGDSVITARAQDIPVKVVHTTYQNGLGATIFKKDKGISTPADLKGKTIGVTSFGSPNYIQLQVLLEQNGMSIDDVNTKIVGTGSIVNALVADEVDAITFSMLRTVELRNSGVEVEEFRSDEFLPSFGNVVVTSDRYLESNKETVICFNNALNKALDYIINGNAREAIEMSIAKYAPSFEGREDLTEEIFNEVFIPYLWQSEVTEQEGYGASKLEKWQVTIDTLKEYEVINKDLKAEDFVIPKLQ